MDEILEGENVEATDERGERRTGKVVRVGDVVTGGKTIRVLDIVWDDDESLSLAIPADGAERVTDDG